MLRETRVKARLTPPYTPQCNPEKRQNRVIKTMIAQYAGRNQHAWGKYLSEIQFAGNMATHEYTPGILRPFLTMVVRYAPSGALLFLQLTDRYRL